VFTARYELPFYIR
jgi:hypothetical protein